MTRAQNFKLQQFIGLSKAPFEEAICTLCLHVFIKERLGKEPEAKIALGEFLEIPLVKLIMENDERCIFITENYSKQLEKYLESVLCG